MRRLLGAARASPLLGAGLVIVAFLVLVAVVAPWLAPYDPKATAGDSFEQPSAAHLLGTDDTGADIFSRLVFGARNTLVVATAGTVMTLMIGIAVGVAAGLRGGFIDMVAMRVVDVFLALPVLPLLILVAALAGPGRVVSILMVGLFLWPQTARLVRSQTLTLRQGGFVASARGFGARPTYVMRRHLLPALGPIIGSNLVYVAGLAVSIEAGLAFLGLGDPVAVSWGNELSRALGNPEIYIGWTWLWWLMPAGVAVTMAILGFTFIGVGLEPRFNPRWERMR